MKLKSGLLSVFFPERCIICGEIKPFLKAYCPICAIDTKALSADACSHCGHENCICDKNISLKLPHFSAVYYYQGQIRKSMLKYKFYGESSYADVFGKAMAKRIKDIWPDTVFDGVSFVPMTESAVRKRGYNQSELLAIIVSRELNLKLIPCLIKTKESCDQKNLTSQERLRNIEGSFAINKNADIKGKNILLCDDIKTTGATLRECCDTLITAGAADVYCHCLTITPYLNETDLF